MDNPPRVVIVGAGPAGLAAARHLVEGGIRPVVLEESARAGGQGTRRLVAHMSHHRNRIYGRAASGMAARETVEDAVLSQCDFRTGTLVWGSHAGRLELLGPDGYDSLPYTHLLIAVGATDRVLPLPGWTLPGVFTLGGAQVALKRHASFIGDRIVFAGSSPLMYLAAAQYLRLGHPDLTILDTTPLSRKIRSFPAMMRHAPKTALQGISLMAELRRAGIKMAFGVALKAIEGGERVNTIEYATRGGQIVRTPVGAVALGYGLRPELQLAELAGATLRYDKRHRQWFAQVDAMGQATDGLWIAGDGSRIGGAEAADAAGFLAAESMLTTLGHPAADPLKIRHSRRRLKRQQCFQDAMTGAFQWPAASAPNIPDETLVCRCERICAGEIRHAITTSLGPVEINRVKAVTRCGMGRCQGRFCGPALGELVAIATGEAPGYLRAQAPIRPVPLLATDSEHT
ncbi:NAD(P)/FAD-dependent oxidoreductase [Roseovarius aestuarii]|nr:NAD(P)/FAD-dependent oxidoreductase [Roseovarius aestuarii]